MASVLFLLFSGGFCYAFGFGKTVLKLYSVAFRFCSGCMGSIFLRTKQILLLDLLCGLEKGILCHITLAGLLRFVILSYDESFRVKCSEFKISDAAGDAQAHLIRPAITKLCIYSSFACEVVHYYLFNSIMPR